MDLIHHKGHEVGRIDVVGKTKDKVEDKEGLEGRTLLVLSCGGVDILFSAARSEEQSHAGLSFSRIHPTSATIRVIRDRKDPAVSPRLSSPDEERRIRKHEARDDDSQPGPSCYNSESPSQSRSLSNHAMGRVVIEIWAPPAAPPITKVKKRRRDEFEQLADEKHGERTADEGRDHDPF